MRREGRVTGNLRSTHNYRRAVKEKYEQFMQDLGFSGPIRFLNFDIDLGIIKVLNKPTNESKLSGRCMRPACGSCHAAPTSKALSKTKGVRNKGSQSRHSSLQDYVDAYSDVFYEGYEISDDDEYVAGVIDENQHEAGCEDDGGDDEGHIHVNAHHPIMVTLGVGGDQQGSLLHHHSVESASQQPGVPYSPDSFLPCNYEFGSLEWCLIAHPDEEPGEDDSWILC